MVCLAPDIARFSGFALLSLCPYLSGSAGPGINVIWTWIAFHQHVGCKCPGTDEGPGYRRFQHQPNLWSFSISNVMRSMYFNKLVEWDKVAGGGGGGEYIWMENQFGHHKRRAREIERCASHILCNCVLVFRLSILVVRTHKISIKAAKLGANRIVSVWNLTDAFIVEMHVKLPSRSNHCKPQATGLDAWASRVKCPARFVSHLHDICICMSCL